MFETKNKELFSTKQKKTPATSVPKTDNAFLKGAMKKAVQTTALGNGALKVTTTSNDFVDQFAKCTAYKAPRGYAEVAQDMNLLWSQDQGNTVRLALYLRLITRVVSFSDGRKTTQTQRGQGLRNEGIFRMIWLAINQPNTFWRNIHLFVASGCWKDLITMLSTDLQYHKWEGRKLNWDGIGQFILAGLENPRSSELVKKYLPQIKTNSNCTTIESQADNIIAKWLCSLIFGTKLGVNDASKYKKYRKLKSSGTAHQWQQLISKGKMLSIDFDSIHGRALSLLVSGKFLKNQNLETKYTKWIESKPIAKYTGYPYELLAPVKVGYTNAQLSAYQLMTIDKQFMGLIEVAKNGMKEGDTGLLVVVDTSSSMTSMVPGTKVSAYSVAKAMALYFSYLLKGRFEGHWAEFASGATMRVWKGETPTQRIQNDRCEAYGSTDFQSVGRLFVDLKNQGIPESDFPSGILCVSDGCFNSVGSNENNFQQLKRNLSNGGFSKDYIDNFKVILWDIPNYYYGGKTSQAFEDFADAKGLFHISGLDPAAVAFIIGIEGKEKVPTTSEELFEAAMDQEILQMVQI